MSSEMSSESNSSESCSSYDGESSNNLTEASDDELEMMFDSDNDDEEFAGFGIDLPTDIEYENERFQPPTDEFALPVGPTMDLHDSVMAIEFFCICLTTD